MKQPSNKNKSGSNNIGERRAFRAWLDTLTWDQLEEAMAFAVQDLDLLSHLVSKHRPLPTPLHPRSVPRPYASAKFPEYSSRYRPARLLKLVPKVTEHAAVDPELQQLLQPATPATRDNCVYSVLGRQFPQADGNYLSVPPLHILQQADEELERCTIVDHQTGSNVVRFQVRTFLKQEDKEENSGDSSQSKGKLLHLLRIVSRGQFGTRAPIFSSPWAPWLQPTQNWFTLSAYFAACYECSLWKAFRSGKDPLSFATRNELSTVRDVWIYTAVEKALTLTLKLETKMLLSKGHFRDLSIYQMLLIPSTVSSLLPRGIPLWHTPIGQLELPVDKLRRTAIAFLQQIVADHAMEALLNQDMAESDDTRKATNARKRPNKKKHGKRRSKRETGATTNKAAHKPLGSSDEEAPSELTSEEDAFDEEPLDFSLMLRNKRTTGRDSGRVKPNSSPSMCTNAPTAPTGVASTPNAAQDSTAENMTAVTAILSDIIEEVFLQVGISEDGSDGAFQTVIRGGRKAKPPPPVRKPAPTNQTSLDPKHLPKPPSRPSPPSSTAFGMSGQQSERAFVPAAPLHGHPQVEVPYQFDPFSGQFIPDPYATVRTSNTEGSSNYGVIDPEFFQQPDSESMNTWDVPKHLDWGRLRGFTSRDESILAEFFVNQDKEENKDVGIASSTAASLASSSGDDDSDAEASVVDEGQNHVEVSNDDATFGDEKNDAIEERLGSSEPCLSAESVSLSKQSRTKNPSALTVSPQHEVCPSIPPIQVSLSDISQMQKKARDRNIQRSESSRCSEPPKATSVSPSRRLAEPKKIVTSLSRDNLRASLSEDSEGKRPRKKSLPSVETGISYRFAAAGRTTKARDDHDLRSKVAARRSSGATSSYRNVAISPGLSKCRDDNDIRLRPQETPPRLSSYRSVAGRPHVLLTSKSSLSDSPSKRSSQQFEIESVPRDFQYAEEENRGKIGRVQDGHERKEQISLREERDSYRDMCLNLGAEVASLRSQLAVQIASIGVQPANDNQRIHQQGSLAADNMSSHTYHVAPRARTLAALSDAGYRGEHDSLASEDEIVAKVITTKNPRHISSAVTVTESDASLDQTSGHNPRRFDVPLELTTIAAIPDLAYLNGTQSRLAKDIYHFIESTNEQLNKLSRKKHLAVERMTRLVETVWPRAQVKLYGSHATGLCVPGSDLDFVVCLPRVHTYEVADAPGALEGRNAINETSQKQLARRLKGESWIDPGSMKLIERTFVPVIKVATKDTRAKTIHLDISFDFPGHHGLEAVNMIQSLCGEIPSLRSLVIILKRFLIDRGLLEAYSGGLSSYCLFLMTARYLQDQERSLDIGSLLMGFLDFYGNYFDPRSTAISVRHRMYFARPNYLSTESRAINSYSGIAGTSAASVSESHAPLPRRNGHRHPHKNGMHAHSVQMHPGAVAEAASDQSTMPFTFDPLFVEDPLSTGNNVGRNTFRIFQIQRAFSDAHRALMAALEWDMHSEGNEEESEPFPLLKCLLQSEDIVFDL